MPELAEVLQKMFGEAQTLQESQTEDELHLSNKIKLQTLRLKSSEKKAAAAMQALHAGIDELSEDTKGEDIVDAFVQNPPNHQRTRMPRTLRCL